MSVSEITNRLVAAQTALVGKLGAQPKMSLSLSVLQNGAAYVGIYGTDDYDDIGRAAGETFAECLDDLDAFIAAMPSPETTKLHSHMKRIAACIDKGREDGIDDAYITPLVVVKAAMTENLLTKE